MQITRFRAGSLTAAEVDAVLPELLAFDAAENSASGLGPDFGPLPASLRQGLLHSDEYSTREHWIGRIGDEDEGGMVATGIAYLSLADNTDSAEVSLAVRPDRRREGLGSQLLERMRSDLRADGRTILTSFHESPVSHHRSRIRDPHLATRSGVGSVPATLPAAGFLTSQGFDLLQLERCSVAPTAQAAGISVGELNPGYHLLTWTGPTPEEHLGVMAALRRKMSTDTPAAAEFGDEEVWDAARVRALDQRRAEAGEEWHTALALAEVGVPPAGFTEVCAYPDRPRIGWQGGTLVAIEHRGHRLGAHLKIANHAALSRDSTVERVYTWNAVENSWMLAINDLAGFATHAWTGVWKQRLA